MEKISIIVPCYNEEECIKLFYEELKKVLNELKEQYDYELIFVDDGSRDETLKNIKEIKQKDNKIRIISFSRNFGKEAAMYGGLENCSGELVVIMDADLQHQPKVILEMVKGIQEGFDVVATVRKDRKGEEKIRSFFSRGFYSLVQKGMDIKIKPGLQDFRIMKRQVVESILELKEYNRFSKGIFSWVGFNIKYISVENTVRIAGKTKWNLWGLFKYAKEGIISFSTKPLKLAIIFGVIISVISIILGIEILVETLVSGKEVPGYASTITSVLFIRRSSIIMHRNFIRIHCQNVYGDKK